MPLQPPFDMSWGPALVLAGVLAMPFIVVWTLLSESVVLYLLKFHKSYWRCLGNAALANLISGVVGIVGTLKFLDTTKFFFWVNGLVGSPPIDDYQTLSSCTEFLGIAILLAVTWIGSMLLEGMILMALRFWQWSSLSEEERAEHGPIWQYGLETSAIINTVSYIGIAIVLLIF